MLWLKLIHVHKRASRRHCNLLKAISKYILHRRTCRYNHTVITAISYKHHGISITGKLTVCSSSLSGHDQRQCKRCMLMTIRERNRSLTDGFPSQRASYLDIVCVSCHHHGSVCQWSAYRAITRQIIYWNQTEHSSRHPGYANILCAILISVGYFFYFELFGRNRSCSCCNGKWLLNI